MSSNVKTVKKVYRELSINYHPDKAPDKSTNTVELYKNIFQDIKTLYESRAKMFKPVSRQSSIKKTKSNKKPSSKKNTVAKPWVPTGMNLVVRNSSM